MADLKAAGVEIGRADGYLALCIPRIERPGDPIVKLDGALTYFKSEKSGIATPPTADVSRALVLKDQLVMRLSSSFDGKATE